MNPRSMCAFVITLVFALGPMGRAAAQNAINTGPGQGTMVGDKSLSDAQDGGFQLKAHTGPPFDNGYAWQYGGVAAMTWGAWAEGFDRTAGNNAINEIDLALTQTGNQGQAFLDIYVWTNDNGNPGNTILIEPVLRPGAVGIWPNVTRHVTFIEETEVPEVYFVGAWFDWVGARAEWYIAADEHGPGTGRPRTRIAAGTGFPTGWQHPSVVSTFAGCKDLGIVVYEGVKTESPRAARQNTWGSIKHLYSMN